MDKKAKLLAPYAALAAINKEGVDNYNDILEVLESAVSIVKFQIEKQKAL